MEQIQNFVNEVSFQTQNISIGNFLINIALVLILSSMLALYYHKYGRTTGNRTSLAMTFPFIALTIFLVITVVKSSLALSLGLVGALSIVRFRTPIKEPEELAYLFFTIAIGLGIGADQRLAVIIVAICLIAFLVFRGKLQDTEQAGNLVVTIRLKTQDDQNIERVSHLCAQAFPGADLRRFESLPETVILTFLVTNKLVSNITEFRGRVREIDPQSEMTVIEQMQIY